MIPSVQLLGVAKVNLDHLEVMFLSDKRFLLLAYLAFKADWVSREHLALLFFEDSDSVSARKNLRHLLSRVRSLDWVNLESSGEQVRWLVQSDVAQFQELIGAERFLEALDLFQGQFLSGLHSDVLELSNWLNSEREALHHAFQNAGLLAANQFVMQSNFVVAQKICSRVLATDPLNEDILQVLLTCAVQTGSKLEALKAFESFKTLLHNDLGLLPLETTVQLAVALRLEVQKPLVKSGLQNFPVLNSSFVGRDVDLSEIASLFAQPDVRLMTLVGAGGMGKSRLAMQVAFEQVANFADGAVFVPLAAADDLVAATIAALNLPAQNLDGQLVFLKNYLVQTNLLLVLDNMEHLLEQSNLILELLAAAPKIRLLLTSREALQVQAEYLVDVLGLDVPKADSEQIEIFDSVQLFLRNAKRVNPRFVLGAEDKPFIVEICGLLQGSPLAIELASHWVRILKPEEVVQEIRLSLDFLTANQPDVPLRHRSMRAVFNASWQLLNPEQQMVLAKMSLLRGGFTLESLARVTKAKSSILFGLVSKSLMARNGNRFTIHEVIRQFAEQQLEPTQKDAALLELSLLAQDWALSVAIHDPEKSGSENVVLFEQEFENISTALEWAARNKPPLAAQIVTNALEFWFSTAKKPLAIEWASQLLELSELQARDAIRANLLSVRSFAGYLILDPKLRLRDAEQALDIALEIGDLAAQAKALHAVGEAAGEVGDYTKAISSVEKALCILENLPNIKLELGCLNQLAHVHWLQGNMDLALQVYENLINQSIKTNFKRGLATGYLNSAYVYISTNDLNQAKVLLEQAVVLYRELKSTVNLCYAVLVLCDVLLKLGDQLRTTELLPEAGMLCTQVQEAGCSICFYWLCAAIYQQTHNHAKALRLDAITSRWRSAPGLEPSLENEETNPFKKDQSTMFFTKEQLQRFEVQAKSLSSKEAMQYALGTLELFEDKEMSKSFYSN
jgi:predicted ATPase/DNA-binding SARP family transcriptional activator